MTTTGKGSGPSWERQQVSFWITPQRKHDLVDLAQGLPDGATASDVIASAIATAHSQLNADQPSSTYLAEAIDSAIASAMTETRDAVKIQSQAIKDMGKGLRSIHALLAALAGEEGQQEVDGGNAQAAGKMSACPQAFRLWLDASLAATGARPQRSAVVKAAWSSVSRVSDRLVSVDFLASLVAIDGKPVETALATASTVVRFDLLEASHPFANVDWSAQLYFVCQPVGTGWVIHGHRVSPDGAAGAAIGLAKA